MADRKQAEKRGRRAESLAAYMLMLKGYTILARRARTPAGEIDLIARRRNLVAFVEVKARATPELCVEAVTPTARGRITRAAELWMARRGELGECDWRFDIVGVVPPRSRIGWLLPFGWPQHFQDSWRPDFTITGR